MRGKPGIRKMQVCCVGCLPSPSQPPFPPNLARRSEFASLVRLEKEGLSISTTAVAQNRPKRLSHRATGYLHYSITQSRSRETLTQVKVLMREACRGAPAAQRQHSVAASQGTKAKERSPPLRRSRAACLVVDGQRSPTPDDGRGRSSRSEGFPSTQPHSKKTARAFS